MAASLSFLSHLKPHPWPPQLLPSPFPSSLKPSSFISFSLARPTSSSSLSSAPSSSAHQLRPNFSPTQLLETLKKENDPEMVLWVFDWASQQPNFKPTLSVYQEVLRKLGNEGSFDSMKRVLQEMKQSGCKINEGTFLIFIESYVGRGLYDEAVSVIDMMQEQCGVNCGTHTFNFLLNILVEGRRLKLVENVHSRMVESGVKPDVSTFNILIKGLCKAHQIRPALLMMEEMDGFGLTPDEKTYTTIIQGYVEEGNMDGALRVTEQMFEAGCSATAVTVNVLVNGFCKEGVGFMAQKFTFAHLVVC